MGVFGFGMVADVVSALAQSLMTTQYVFLVVAVAAFSATYVCLVHFLTRGPAYYRWLTYLTITVDCALPAALVLEMTRPEFAARIGIDSVLAVNALVIVIIIMLNALRLRPWAVIYASLLGAAIALGSTLLFSSTPLLRIWLAPLILITGAVTYWISRNFGSIIQALRRREKLSRFLPRDLVKILENSDLEVTLGGKTTNLTILFADIRGFTRFCENRTPQEIVEVLNDYFTTMSSTIRDQGGMIDKYIGDAVMAVFGAPLPRQDHAARAVESARAMLRQLDVLNRRWAEAGRPPFRIGIALHTGTALAGTIGAPDRMDYTVIGDTVNLAARLEELNKTYHTALILSEETCREMGTPSDARFLGQVAIRGRESPVRIYTLETVTQQP